MEGKELPLLLGFYPFRNDAEIQALSQSDDGVSNGRIFRVGEYIAHKGAIYLQLVQRHVPQIGKR